MRATPGRSVGASFLHGAGFKITLVTPPLAFVAFAFVGRMRDRLSRDDQRTSRRRLRSIARRRLHAAAAHRDAGRAAAFYVEIERVLREALSEKLRVPVGGLRLEELGDLLRARGMPADDVTRVLSVLEACDEARFSPGGEPAGKPAQDAMLERAAALIDTVEKAPLASGRVGMKAALRTLALAVFALLVGQGSARADRVDEAWRRGNEAYLHGDYAGAVAAYEEVDRQGAGVGRRRVQPRRRVFPQGGDRPRDLGRSSARWRSIRTTRTRATTSTRRASWRHGARTIASRARTRIPAWMRLVGGLSSSTVTWSFIALYLGVLRGAAGAALGAPARRVRR